MPRRNLPTYFYLICGIILASVNCTKPKGRNPAKGNSQGSVALRLNDTGDGTVLQAVAADNAGNLIAAGSRHETRLPTDTGNDPMKGYLVKYAPDGRRLWQQSISGGCRQSSINGMAVDASGNIIVAGYQEGKRDCSLNTLALTGATPRDNLFIAKLSADGKGMWILYPDSGKTWSQIRSLDIDSAGNIYAAGEIGEGALTLGSTNISSRLSLAVLIIKITGTGRVQWMRSADKAQRTARFNAVRVSPSGDIFAVGMQGGLSPGANIYGDFEVRNSTAVDAPLLIKYTPGGDVAFAYAGGTTTGGADFRAITFDASGNYFIAGEFDAKGPLAIGSHPVIGSGSLNSVLVKFSAADQPVWARSKELHRFGTVLTTADGDLYVGSVSFPGQEYGGPMAGCRGHLATLLKYDTHGKEIWSRTGSCGTDAYFYGLAFDRAGKLYAAGYQSGEARFGTIMTGSADRLSGLLLKLD